MILKLLARHNPIAIGTTLRYINREEAFAFDGVNNGIAHNLRLQPNATLADIENAFLEQEAYRTSERRGRIFCYHTIISIKGSELSQDDMKQIAHKYFELRGDIVAFGIPHFDTDNNHLHVLEASNFYRRDKASGLRKKELIELKKELEKYIQQEYPHIQSDVVHGTGKGLSQQQHNIAHQGQTIKQRITLQVETCLQNSKTREALIANLNKCNLLHYERSANHNEITGVISASGKKYRFRTLGIDQDRVNALSKVRDIQKEDTLLQQMEDIRKRQQKQDKDIEH
ncbi:MAG TPA: hypothetical protein DCX01_09515 [Bacteroidetes bacterium]|nr:hypothetical protein [Bacteroidota bacterium]